MPISKIKSSSITADAASTNLNIDANTLFLDATNNRVGVGTTTPASKLDVSGSDSQIISKVTNTNTAGQAATQLITNTAALYSAAFGSTAGGTTWAGLTGSGQTVIEAQNSSSLVIGAFNNSAPIIFAQGRAEVARIDTAGNVVIGSLNDNVASANQKLLIAASPEGATLHGMFIHNNSYSAASARIALSPRYSFFYNTSPYIQAVSESTSAAALTFGTTTGGAVSERMRITSAGNVGIGTTNPTTKLHIVQSSAATAIKVITDDYPTGTNGGTMSGSLEFVGSGWNSTLGAREVGVMVEPIAAYWGADQNMSGYGQTYPYLNFKTKNSDSEYITRARVDGFGRFWMNSGYGSIAIAYGCRAWARITGAGGSGGSPGTAIEAGGNVSSLTRNSTGNYTLNFTNSMPDASYAFSGNQETGNETFECIMISYNQYTTSVNFITLNSRIQDDFRYGSIAIFR